MNEFCSDLGEVETLILKLKPFLDRAEEMFQCTARMAA
ncbi:hypothetical protein L288_03135 [Sphingobium quisquiliarum P25]|uniref:Uncharacterized protein n=1 Tax=Sphingobium quisquiliarum P25 TaxID=1329909 RepID=T0HF00_9SPHN|nr:hypothetical protein L288_03135 [Sphingobium quisquiliarum P25]